MDLPGLLIFDQASNIKSPGRSIYPCQTSSLASPDPLPWARARNLQTCIPGARCSQGRLGPWAQHQLVREPLPLEVARAEQASSAQFGNPPIQSVPSAAVALSWAAGPSSMASEPYAAVASSAVVAAANCSTLPTVSRAAILRRHTPGGSTQCLGGRVPTAVTSSWAAGQTSSRAADEASWAAAASYVGVIRIL